ncbi:MAG: DNA-binding protein WhiA [Alphaproteobacteria bacterium]
MSFASDIKKEISGLTLDDCCYKAELYELIRLKSSISISNHNFKVTFATSSNQSARRIVFLLKHIYQKQVEILKKDTNKLDFKPLYIISFIDEEMKILFDLQLINADYTINKEIARELFAKDCCKASILRGAFLAKGSINDPKTNNYHFEIVCPNKEDAAFIFELLQEMCLEPKIISRSKGEVVYLKKAEHIGDFLRHIGASTSLFAFEDLRIKKDLNNYVNRIMNCDVANEQKAIATAAKQLDDIAFLEKHLGLMNLTPRLMDAVILRTTFPDDSLAQLSEHSEEAINHYVSKSGLSHCFRDLGLLVIEIKKNKQKLT